VQVGPEAVGHQDRPASMLAAMDEDERAALLAQFGIKGKKGK
jgi:hypothetical protein